MSKSRRSWSWKVKMMRFRITFPFTNFQQWLCDCGVPCKRCARQRMKDVEALGEIEDILDDIIEHPAFINYTAKPVQKAVLEVVAALEKTRIS